MEYSYVSLQNGSPSACLLQFDSVHTVHVDEAAFALLQLSGEVEKWSPGWAGRPGFPKWWTAHWQDKGNFLCTCGKKETRPL